VSTSPAPVPTGSHVLVVGAGVSGLTAARALRDAGHDVTIVDKGHAVGGRLATRTVGAARFDHGAQFLTVKDDQVRARLEDWERAGVVTPWFRGAPDPGRAVDPDGHPRYRGTPVMRSIAEHLAVGLDVRTGERVRAIAPDAGGWKVTSSPVDGGEEGHRASHALVVTAPAPQTLDLLAAGGTVLAPSVQRVLATVTFDPCLAVLAVPRGATALPHHGALRLSEGPLSFLADDRRKGASPVPAVVVHGAPDISRRLWTASDDEVSRTLLAAAEPHLGVAADAVHVHRWRYARPTSPAPDDDALIDLAPAPIVIAGDAFTGGRVEGAIRSGDAAARHLLAVL
jgi:renalase